MTAQIFNWRSVPTFEDNYILDFERGLFTHSKFLTPKQFTRYLRTQNTTTRPDMIHEWEKDFFFRTYIEGERLITYKRSINLCQATQMVRSCSKTYFYKHFFDVFGPSYAMTMNGIYKGRQPGQLRSNTEKKSIADYVNKCRQLAFDLGVLQIPQIETNDEKVERITNNLREKYMKKKTIQKSQQ